MTTDYGPNDPGKVPPSPVDLLGRDPAVILALQRLEAARAEIDAEEAPHVVEYLGEFIAELRSEPISYRNLQVLRALVGPFVPAARRPS